MAPSTRIGYRAFDRQWIIADARLLDRPRPPLWQALDVEGQVFAVEQHSQPIADGPALVFTALLPELHHFNHRGGRALPLFHPDASANVAHGLLDALSAIFHTEVTAASLLAYIAGVAAHPAFTRCFAEELTTPGLRIPITTSKTLWNDASALGEWIVWLHTYGDVYPDTTLGRPAKDIRLGGADPLQPLCVAPIGPTAAAMPTAMSYDPHHRSLIVGAGRFAPVSPEVWSYTVGGKNVLSSWFNYRKGQPGGRHSSPLDRIHLQAWPAEWSVELIDLLTVLTRLVEAEPAQESLLRLILAGPLLRATDLAEAGVRWPSTPRDRACRRLIAHDPGTLDLTL